MLIFFGCESVACGYRRDFYAESKRLKMYMRPNRFRCSIMQRNRGTCIIAFAHVISFGIKNIYIFALIHEWQIKILIKEL